MSNSRLGTSKTLRQDLTHRFPRSSSIWQVFHTDISRFEGLRTAISGQFLVKPWLRTHIWGLADQQYRQEYLPI